jgi:hypothetical protein
LDFRFQVVQLNQLNWQVSGAYGVSCQAAGCQANGRPRLCLMPDQPIRLTRDGLIGQCFD